MLEMLNDIGAALNTRSATSPVCKANAQRNAAANPIRSAIRPLASGPSVAPISEHHPILCAGDEASAESARDKVD